MRVECPEPVEGLVWVYILLMCNGMLYVGQSHVVARRMERHADGTGSRQAKQLKEEFLLISDLHRRSNEVKTRLTTAFRSFESSKYEVWE